MCYKLLLLIKLFKREKIYFFKESCFKNKNTFHYNNNEHILLIKHLLNSTFELSELSKSNFDPRVSIILFNYIKVKDVGSLI